MSPTLPSILQDFLKIMQIPDYSEEMTAKFTTSALIFGIISAVLLILAAILAKKKLVIGIFAGLFSFFTCYMTPKFIESFHTIELFKQFTGSQAEVDAMVSEYYQTMLPKSITMIVFSILLILTFVFTLILAGGIMSRISKPFGVLAIVFSIVRFALISPLPMYSSILSGATIEAQASQLTVFFVSTLIPAVFLAIGAMIKKHPAEE